MPTEGSRNSLAYSFYGSTEWRYSVDWVEGAFQIEENYGCRVMVCGAFQVAAEGSMQTRSGRILA